MADVALEIARVPELTPDLLAVIEEALLRVYHRDSVVSVRTVETEVQDRFTAERLEGLFFALTQAGVLARVRRDRRGHSFDQYRVDRDRLRQTIHDAVVARHVLEQMEAEQAGGVQLVATFPDSLPLDPQIRRTIPSLAAALHRLITEAESEIIILNPFFEQEGFERLSTALLAAAARGVLITIITRQLSDPASPNHQVLSRMARQATAKGLDRRFVFYQYQQVETDHIVGAAHAKVLLADRRMAYVGSANLTEYGMARFLEIGVILRGASVGGLRQLAMAMLTAPSAERIFLP